MQRPFLPHISLIGDPEENFYQLGLKDQENFSSNQNHLNSLLKIPLPTVDTFLKQAMATFSRSLIKDKSQLFKLLNAYAEGLDVPLKQVTHSILLPEIMSCLNKWIPGAPLKLFAYEKN